MRTDYFFDSCGAGKIHCCKWTPEGEARAVVQIVHGIAEYIERYDAFADYLNSLGFLVVAEDHMGHGQSIGQDGTPGYFHNGWFSAVRDTVTLLQMTRQEYPELPYVLFGHSMGSFMARTILCKYPDSGISAAVICGTGWQPRALLPAAIGLCELECRKIGKQTPGKRLENLVFGGNNRRVEHPRTEFDWLSRDSKMVDAYIAHPLCGFTASCGLFRDLLMGIQFVEKPENLKKMRRDLPVLFVAGGDDPVGNYGKGVRRSAEAFRKVGMKDVTERIFPLCRHEILNEINREEIFSFIARWMVGKVLNN